MITNKNVIEELQMSVTTAVTQSTDPTTPVKYIDVDFETPDAKWLEIIIIPNDPSDVSWNSEHVYRGVMRLVLHQPRTGSGLYDALEYVDGLKAFYSKTGLISEHLRLLNIPRLTVLNDAPNELLLALTVEYQSFSS